MRSLSMLIKTFATIQNFEKFNLQDLETTRSCIKEEAEELINADSENILEEAADVLITVMLYLYLNDKLEKLDNALFEKMKTNFQKPIRTGKGKVRKK